MHRQRRGASLDGRRARASRSAASRVRTPRRSSRASAAADADERVARRPVRGAGLDPPSDVHASADYRRHLAEVVRRAGRRDAAGRGASVEPRQRAARSRSRSTATRYEREVDARRLLVHFLRDDLDLTGTHVGCDTGNCGACTRARRRRRA